MYVYNMFWDATAATQDNIDLSVVAGSAVRPQGDPQRQFAPERRWVFDDMGGALVSGDGVRAVLLVNLEDQDWGYSGGRVRALRVVGTGEIVISLPDSLQTSDFKQVIVRFRSSLPGSRAVGFHWRAKSAPEMDRALQSATADASGWQVITLRLTPETSWTDAGEAVDLRAVLTLDPLTPEVVDIDFIIIGD